MPKITTTKFSNMDEFRASVSGKKEPAAIKQEQPSDPPTSDFEVAEPDADTFRHRNPPPPMLDRVISAFDEKRARAAKPDPEAEFQRRWNAREEQLVSRFAYREIKVTVVAAVAGVIAGALLYRYVFSSPKEVLEVAEAAVESLA
jgi:hypothetical protein